MNKLKGWQLLLVVTLFTFISLVSGEISTTLEINYVNIPPQLMDQIPDQIWAMNTNLTNAFDLDNYFLDTDESINYTASAVDTINISINETTHLVSFYPNLGFQGIKTVIFTASDGQLTSNSNTVTLNVTPDHNPPTWSNPSVSSSEIKQNSIPTFSATWQDDTGLGYFILSLNQAGTWVNQSQSVFSGKLNISSYSAQISAPAGTIVYWSIFGFDTSGNMNFTTIKNFTVAAAATTTNQTQPPKQSSGSSKTKSGTSKSTDVTESTRDFTLDPATGFKIDILEGEDKTISFKITNTGTLTDKFNISILDLEKFDYTISNNNFTISPGASTVITVNLKAKTGTLPDLYYGSISVRTNSNLKKIPLVIQLNALITKIGVNLTIIDKKEFLPLQKVTANITLTNLQDIKSNQVYAYYALVDFSGQVIDSTSEQFIFDSRSVNLQKNFTLPSNIALGTYIFFVRAVTNGSVVIDSESFEVGERATFASLVLGNIWIIVLLGSIFITFIIGLTEYRNRKRLQLLNMYIMTNELSRLVKENNFNEAEKVFVKIKNYYHETISEDLMNNKEKLHEEIKIFSNKIDADLYANKAAAIKAQEASAPPAAATPAPTSKETASTKIEDKTVPPTASPVQEKKVESKKEKKPIKKIKKKLTKNGKKK